MQFFLDTANLKEIEEAKRFGIIDGVTTNPTLLSREGGDWREQMKSVCKVVDGPVSLEVTGTTADEMIKEARELVTFGPNVVVKVPMIQEGLMATKTLSDMGIETNVTLVFSPLQALLAAKAGATYVSPFVGRLDGIGHDGMELISQVVQMFGNYGFDTKVLVASVRDPLHILDSALIGADVATMPFKVIKQLVHHPLTDKGLASFLDDWKKLTQS